MGRYQIRERRAAAAARFHRSSLHYQSQRDLMMALRQRARELPQMRVRFGYRRLIVLLRREGWDLGKHRFIGSTPRRRSRPAGALLAARDRRPSRAAPAIDGAQ